MNNIIISDTSCLIALDRIGRLSLLKETFIIIYTTTIVAREFESLIPDWIHIKDAADIEKVEQLKLILDPGEASAISLALETKNAVLIIDEKKGRRIAQGLNIPIIGTLKVLLIAKSRGVITSVKPIIDDLQKHSFRFNKVIVDEVLRLANEV